MNLHFVVKTMFLGCALSLLLNGPAKAEISGVVLSAAWNLQGSVGMDRQSNVDSVDFSSSTYQSPSLAVEDGGFGGGTSASIVSNYDHSGGTFQTVVGISHGLTTNMPHDTLFGQVDVVFYFEIADAPIDFTFNLHSMNGIDSTVSFFFRLNGSTIPTTDFSGSTGSTTLLLQPGLYGFYAYISSSMQFDTEGFIVSGSKSSGYDFEIELNSVPEPSTYFLLLLGAAVLFYRIRRLRNHV